MTPAADQARGLLPCQCGTGDPPHCTEHPACAAHSEDCPAYYRPAIAAALAEREERAAKLQNERDAADGTIASITDLLNSACRELHIEEAPGVHLVKDAVERVWITANRLRHRAEQAEGRAAEYERAAEINLKMWQNSEAALKAAEGRVTRLRRALEVAHPLAHRIYGEEVPCVGVGPSNCIIANALAETEDG